MQTSKTGKKKTLNVQKVSLELLEQKWGRPLFFPYHAELFIRSDKKGNVNWDKAPVYLWREIVKEKKIREVHFTVNPEIFK